MEPALSNPQAVASEAVLSVRIRKRFRDAAQASFQLAAEFQASSGITILFGASGAGKTTILDCIAGLQTPDEGAISIGIEKLFDSAANVNIPARRRRVGYLVQTLALFPHMTVVQNIEYGLAALDAAERKQRSQEIMDSFQISALAQRRPGEISGGERQRVALARTLVTRPRALLLDEPLTGLDVATKARIIDDVRKWNQRFRIPVLYVTHDRNDAFALGERMLLVQNGTVVARGFPYDVLHRPELESVAQLAGFENLFNGTVTERHLEQGTMACRLDNSHLDLELPLTRVGLEEPIHVGIRAGDILIATALPQGLSARNVIPGIVRSLEQRDATVVAHVDCGVLFEVHITLGAMRALQLNAGSRVWLVIKTYSCQVLR
jgi:molybdate transport system ATP-binding protein